MSNFFDPSQHEFSIAMRGYDRAQVDDFTARMAVAVTTADNGRAGAETKLNDVRTALHRHEARAASLEGQLADNADRIDQNQHPTLSGQGAVVEQLFRAAEQDSAKQRLIAAQEAEETRAAAKVQAAQLIETARSESDALRANSAHDASELRLTAKTELAELGQSARDQAEKIRANARRDTDQMRDQAQTAAHDLKTSTQRQIAIDRATVDKEVIQIRASAARECDEQRAAAASLIAEAVETRHSKLQELDLAEAERREQFEQDNTKRHADAVTTGQRIIAEAEHRWEQADEQARLTRQRAEDLETEADLKASELAEQAAVEVAQLLAQAKAEAAQLCDDAKADAQQLVEPVRVELAELIQRKENFSAKLAELRRHLGTVALSSDDSTVDEPDIELLTNEPHTEYVVETPTQQVPAIS